MERLSGLDAMFVYAETPVMHLHVSLLALIDATAVPDAGVLYTEIARQAAAIPEFRRRLLSVPLGLHHPLWVDDPSFEFARHVKRVACPPPGGTAELAELIGRINSTPLDRSRPLWEVWIIDGVAQRQHAVFIKVHHAVVDGIAGAGLLARLLSFSPDARPATPPPLPAATESIPSGWELVRDALRERGQAMRRLGPLARRTLEALTDVRERRTDGLHHAGGTPLDAPRVYWNAPLTAARSAAFARLPLADFKLVRKSFDCTFNDVVLAVCAGALRHHLERCGRLPLAPLVAGCPVAVPGAVKSGGNRVSAMFPSLATNLEDPVERLRAIAGASVDAKEEHATFGGDMAASWAELSIPKAFTALWQAYSRFHVAALHRPLYNVVTSNVPGPSVPLYLAGAKVLAVYPMGPLMDGIGLNITVMSYIDQVDFGFNAATALLPDVASIAAELAPALRELVDRCRPRPLEHRA